VNGGIQFAPAARRRAVAGGLPRRFVGTPWGRRAVAGLLSAAFIAGAGGFLLAPGAAVAQVAPEEPQALIERKVQELLDQFTARRAELEADRRALFALVDQVAAPLFDFERIAKLVLAQNWRRASAEQRAEFRDAFRQLLIATYATALHQYSGDERMTFTASKITERKGRKFAQVSSEVTLADGAEPIAVEYALLLDKRGAWKIYNLTVGSLNMIVNYRNTYASSVGELGIDGVIAEMKRVNAGNF